MFNTDGPNHFENFKKGILGTVNVREIVQGLRMFKDDAPYQDYLNIYFPVLVKASETEDNESVDSEYAKKVIKEFKDDFKGKIEKEEEKTAEEVTPEPETVVGENTVVGTPSEETPVAEPQKEEVEAKEEPVKTPKKRGRKPKKS